MNKNNKVIILTGPCGVGKTAIAKIIAEKIEVELVDGDKIKENLFPGETEEETALKILRNIVL